MAQFIIHKDNEEGKRSTRKNSEGGASSFWVPFAIVIAGVLIAGAVIFKDSLRPGVKPIGNDLVLSKTPSTSAPTQPPQAAKAAIPLDDSPVLGEASASVTITEFTDFQCPACYSYFNNAFPQVKSEYIDKGLAKYVTKQFPLRNIHPNAQISAESSVCAQDQNAFAKYHDLLFTKQNEWSALPDPTEKLMGYAGQLGLNGAAFRSCLTGGKAKDQVEKDFQLGNSVGVSGTPTVYVNGTLAGQPGYIPTFAQIKELVDQALRK